MFHSFQLEAVRYGRVPKQRSRDLSSTLGGGGVGTAGSDEVVSTNSVRVNTPSTPSTPTTPQMCSISASPSDINSSTGCGGVNNVNVGSTVGVGGVIGGATTLTTTNISAITSTDSEGTGSTELNVYDIILCVSQAHRTHCTYTEENLRNLIRRPIVYTTTATNTTGIGGVVSSAVSTSDGKAEENQVSIFTSY